MKKGKIKFFGMILFIFVMTYSTPVCAEGIDTSEINRMLDEIFPEENITLEDVVVGLVDEEKNVSNEKIREYIVDTLAGIWKENKTVIASLLLLIIASAIFSNFSSVFQNRQVSEMGFYIIYVLMITICMKAFQGTSDTIAQFIKTLLNFMKILGPIYFLSMSIATGKISAVGFYNLLLFFIYIVELLILRFVLPLVRTYFMIHILNYLSDEEYLSKFSETIQLLVDWTQKTLIACVAGVSVIQGLLSPGVDELKRGAIVHGVEIIPGIGDAIGATGEMALGTAVLLKNGIGMAGAIIVILIASVPFINMAMVTLMYKLLAAVIQPISDKRIVGVVSGLSDVSRMLFRVVGSSTLLFLLTIGITATFTT